MSRDRYSMSKLAQGYTGPEGRPGCRDCAHAAEVAGRERRSAWDPMDCRLGAFLVHPWGICDRHQPRAPRLPAAPGGRQ